MREHGIEHYRGKQFRYVQFLCNKAEKKRLTSECTVPLSISYPKDADLIWRRQTGAGSWEESEKPAYKTDFCRNNLITFDFSRKAEDFELEEWML
jgi:hypothetical protein